MAVLSANGISKSFGGRELFHEVSFLVENKDIFGFVGANGAGKTTLFKILLGEMEPDSGTVVRSTGSRIGYLEQHACKDSEHTAYEETLTVFQELIDLEHEIERVNKELLFNHSQNLIEKQLLLTERYHDLGGLTYKNRTKAVLNGLGFDEEQQQLPVSALSGGQRSKIGLARLLLSKFDLILLDEPTNHLDINSVEWLEEYLISSNIAAIVISHDRFFLNKISNHTLSLETGKIYVSDGNYSRYMELREERLYSEQRHYDNTMREVHRIEGIIEQQRRWNREKNIKTAESKQKQIDRMTKDLVKPETERHSISFDFDVKLTGGNDVLAVKGLFKEFDGRPLYHNVDFTINRGEKVFLIGANGCGKTTLLKQILALPEGVRLGAGVSVGYFDQLQNTLDPGKNVLLQIHDRYQAMTETAVRNALAVFEFKGDDVFKKVETLSGGERARVAICQLMLSGDNLLFLDEPTNHLDLYSREALETALLGYQGTMLIVSHDRYFINRLSDKIVVLDRAGTVTYQGNYDDYLQKRPVDTEIPETENNKTDQKGKEQYLKNKQLSSQKRKLTTALLRCEVNIEAMEKELEEIKEQIQNSGDDYQKLLELTSQVENSEHRLEELLNEWEAVSEEIGNLTD